MTLPLNKRKLLSAQNAEFIARLILGGLFIYSSIHKIIDPAQFARIISNYDLFPLITIHPIAVFVPFFELVCGATLILGIYPRGAVLIINLMLLMFIIAITINLARGHEFDCGCFSFSHNAGNSAANLLIRDFLYLILGLFILIYRQRRADHELNRPD